MLIRYLREHISPLNPLLLTYHKLWGMFAATWYRFPGRQLKVIGVTGTNGKTTTVHMTAHILRAAGRKVGVLSSIEFHDGETSVHNISKQTTMGRLTTQRYLRRMVSNGCEFAVLEVTSHAMVQSRLWGVPIDTAVLTNIGWDHIDYHGSLEEYVKAKGRLFADVQHAIVLNGEDEKFDFFDKFSAPQKLVFGLQKGDLHAEKMTCEATESNCTLVAETSASKAGSAGDEEASTVIPMPGDFNVANALAAASVARAYGVNLEMTARALRALTPVPGRYEPIRVSERQPFAVVVDYAHDAEALEKLCKFFRPLTKKDLIIVFGAPGGGRDKGKRPKMGAAASKYCDKIIVTDDDPYTEDRWSIIEQVAAGIDKKEGDGLWKMIGRREAIQLAFSMADEGDTVLIAGKGCEEVIVIGYEKIPYDDRKVARELLMEMPSIANTLSKH